MLKMGKKSRDKGYRGEHNLERILRKFGLDAKRVPLSGASDFAKGDIIVEGRRGEVKVRKEGFKQIYKWLEKGILKKENVEQLRERNDILFIKADRKEYLAVMRLLDLIELLKKVKEYENL